MPLIATIRPARSAWTTWSTGIDSRGPHSGQAVGWAWNRRLVGSVYSARHGGHSGNPTMVVFTRS